MTLRMGWLQHRCGTRGVVLAIQRGSGAGLYPVTFPYGLVPTRGRQPGTVSVLGWHLSIAMRGTCESGTVGSGECGGQCSEDMGDARKARREASYKMQGGAKKEEG
eukprot:768156-Hanusia_phi.AAC.5